VGAVFIWTRLIKTFQILNYQHFTNKSTECVLKGSSSNFHLLWYRYRWKRWSFSSIAIKYHTFKFNWQFM